MISVGRAVPVSVGGSQASDEPESGFYVELREPTEADLVADGASNEEEDTPAQLTPLPDANVAAIYKRLANLEGEEGDKKDFALREKSLPAPKTGVVEQATFPPAEEREIPAFVSLSAQDGSPLTVLRFLPEGEVKIASHVSVTFSHPMVAVATVDDVAAQGHNVTIEPKVDGRFRWVGTKTLLFEPTYRMPLATSYTVTIPKGTTSAIGNVLASDASFSFATPPVTWENFVATSGTGKRMLYLAFDQKVDAKAIAKHVQVVQKGNRGGEVVRLATQADDEFFAAENEKMKQKSWAGNKYGNIKSQADRAEEGTWVKLVLDNAIPASKTVVVSLPRGCPSLEGPRTSEKEQSRTFQSQEPLKVVRTPNEAQSCSQFSVEFNNELDSEVLHADEDEPVVVVRVSPDIEELATSASGRHLSISGKTKGNTTYEVTLLTSLVDVYGQQLAEEHTFSVHVGPLRPSLYAFRQGVFTLDPFRKPGDNEFSYNAVAVNIEKIQVAIWQVDPLTDLQASSYGSGPTRHMVKSRTNNALDYHKSGKLVTEYILETECVTDEPKLISISLAEHLAHKEEALGHLVIVMAVQDELLNNQTIVCHSWVQVTRLSMMTAVAPGDGVEVWVNDLLEAAPKSATELMALPNDRPASDLQKVGKTNARGMAHVDADSIANNRRKNFTLFARNGKDVTFAQHVRSTAVPNDRYAWHIINDRNMYKPKETVHVKGWMRKLGGKVGLPACKELSVPSGVVGTYEALDARRQPLAKGKLVLNAYGAFDLSFDVPDNANLGNCYVQIKAKVGTVNANAHHSFQVQEFRTPEFSISASPDSASAKYTDATHVATASASYYAGGALESSPVHWSVTTSPSSFSPPGLSAFRFGSSSASRFGYRRHVAPSRAKVLDSVTDSDGKHQLAIKCVGQNDDCSPVTVTANARVMDGNNQAQASSCSFLVHASHLYVGLKLEKAFAQENKEIEAKLIVAGVDGVPVGDKEVTVELVESVTKRRGVNTVVTEEVIASVPVLSTTDKEGVPIEGLVTDHAGSFAIRLSVTDSVGLVSKTSVSLWCSGRPRHGYAGPVSCHQTLTVVPDKETYDADDVAKLLLLPPFTPCEGFYSVSIRQTVEKQSFSIAEGGTHVIEVPLSEDYVPNVSVSIEVEGTSTASGQKIAAVARTQTNLPIRKDSKELSIEVTPEKDSLQPGEKTSVSVRVTDHKGNAVPKAEVTLIVVDDAVLALSGYTLASPLTAFYGNLYADSVQIRSTREQVYTLNWNDIHPQAAPALRRGGGGGGGGARSRKAFGGGAEMMCAAAPMMKSRAVNDCAMQECAEAGGAAPPPVADGPKVEVRSNFNPLALFEPTLVTDKDGRGSKSFTMPDNLTSYRVWAIAVDQGERFGSQEESLTAKLPIMLRPSLPRFLNFGDSASAPFMVQNQTGEEQTVQVAMRCVNAKQEGPRGYAVTIAPWKRAVVSFGLSATDSVGTARVQVGAVTGSGHADAAEVSLPVWTPATTEAFATYGELDGTSAVLQPVITPSQVYSQFGGLRVTTSSTALASLTDAFLYLYRYRFECNEQQASKAIGILSLGPVLQAFKVEEAPSMAKMHTELAAIFSSLASRQRSDGGFGYWGSRSGDPSIYVSLHVGWMLAIARGKLKEEEWTFSLPPNLVTRTRSFLLNVLQGRVKLLTGALRNDLLAMVAFVVAELGEAKVAVKEAEKLVKQAKEGLAAFSVEALGRLVVVFGEKHAVGKEILAFLKTRVNETAETANFVTGYSTKETQGGAKLLLMSSSRRTDAVVLEAWLRTQGNDSLIPKLVKGLLAHKKKGRWANTQENCQALVSLGLYFAMYEKEAPDFVARTWLEGEFAGEKKFKGHSAESQELLIPMAKVVTGGDAPAVKQVVIGKEGDAGRLYYRLALSYAPKSLVTSARDAGFVVERKYEAVDEKSDVQKVGDVWQVKAGARVRVTLTMANTSRRYHVALVDKLPAGFEALNPALKTTEALPVAEEDVTGGVGRRCCYRARWFEHQNMRDERVEAFACLLWEGVHTYSYVARATCPGKFVAPAATAEEMYSPEIFGASPSLTVHVIA